MNLSALQFGKFIIALTFGMFFCAPSIHSGELGQGETTQQDDSRSRGLNKSQSDILVQELGGLREALRSKGKQVTLREVIAYGLAYNPKLAESFALIQQQEWALIGAKRAWYPQLQASNSRTVVGYSWQTSVKNFFQEQQDLDSNEPKKSWTQYSTKSKNFTVGPGLIATWSFLDLSRQPRINSQDSLVQQQKNLFAVSARNLVLDLQKTYFALQSNQRLIQSFDQIYEINRRQLEILEARYEIGMVTILDVEKTRAQLFLQLSQLIGYTKNYLNQTAKLANLMGLPKDEFAIPVQSDEAQGSWQKSLQQTIDDAIQHREEILADLEAAEAAEWSGIALLRDYLPVFQLVATGNLISSSGFSGVPVSQKTSESYENSRQWDASLGIGFTWNIFDGGINAANAEAAFAQSRSYMSAREKTENQVVQEVRSSFGEMKTSKIGIESARLAYKSAQAAQRAARARFELGVGEITDVVQAIAQLSQAAQEVSNQTLLFNNSIAELYRFSATWPYDVDKELRLRLQMLRKTS